MTPYLSAYSQQWRDAKGRGIDFQFTFDEWIAWWGDDIHQRGNRANNLCMARLGDTGPYHPNNVYKCTKAENSSHTHVNKPQCGRFIRTPEFIANQRLKHLGQGVKRIKTPLGIFKSCKDAAQAENKSACAISNKTRTHPKQYYYL